ncbi:MAG: DEAD/DEAH box helicase family protein [Lentisphaerae bacterium]|jgi:type III restriction enzyme|nr:DEAD/DEAH box helicase family protein [Lentisphaerota bacterium]
MSIQHVNSISNRLSLRPPQRDSLEILARVCEIIELSKDADPAAALTAIRSEFPTVEDFEREFPSLCFAIATGVGKTRLMGAFIAYLYQAMGIRNFFVLAPNLTIYNKLITDFTPNTPKYVFTGIGEFAVHPPLVVTGDNYEDGRGVRRADQLPGVDWGCDVHINIFNISKINSEVRGGSAPRIKRLSEYIGQSYFDYLAGLDDLVMLMDESHRYRATAGVRAINELKPVLGLELTATPQVVTGSKAEPFKNVIYSYPLATAMTDGFVKEPAVATRQNFDAAAYSDEGLEKVKLEDGVRIHENTKVELEVYARNNEKPIVKPFMLVVATDTTHANALQQVIESDDFFSGRYKGKVIQVHSNIRGEEKDEVIEQLLTVEHADNPVEIVIHVNMLKEGWDVTNLYTIVPLRAANSRTLVEQSIGRGLRLPYGKRVGVPAVDRLTIVSHDKFKEIVDHANDPNSIIRAGVVIGRDIPEAGRKAVEVKSTFEHVIAGGEMPARLVAAGQPEEHQGKLFETPEKQAVAKAAYQVIRQYERLRGSDQLQDEEVQAEIVQKVQDLVRPAQGVLTGIVEEVNLPAVVRETTALYQKLSIDVPKIVVVPKGKFVCGYEDFDLDVSGINLQPVSQDILIQHLHENLQYRLRDGTGIVEEKRPEDYLVRGLIDFDDISYDEHSALLYKLAGQVVQRLRMYLKEENDLINVLQYHQQPLVNLIHVQMQKHYVESATAYEAHVTRGFRTLRANNYTAAADEGVRDFRATLPDGQRKNIGAMVFGGFSKCLYPIQKFDSDSERRFAVILENDPDVEKWFKPAKGDFQIHYSHDESYEPDFVVETAGEKFLCEPKRASEMTDEIVLAKAEAAAVWCRHATAHAIENGGKPWRCLLIPHDEIEDQMTLAGLAARREVLPKQ